MAVIKYRDSNNQWQVIAGGGGGSDLPTPTSADEGKVLMVVEVSTGVYEWQAVALPDANGVNF